MIELASQLLPRLDAGHRIAVATVTRIDGSAPRTLGTAMAVDADGAVIGSISGGCVEGAVYDACVEVLESGRAVVQQFGYSDDDAFAVGLACGGRIEVLVQRIDYTPLLRAELEAAAAGQPVGIALVTGGAADGGGAADDGAGHSAGDSEVGRIIVAGESDASGLSAETTARVLAELASRIAAGRTGLGVIDCDDRALEVLFVVTATAPRMIIFGAVDFSAALADAAALLGYRVTMCDARAVFATAARFPAASEVVVQWPADYLAATEVDRRTVVCVLTHDDKFDVPLLEVALRLPIAYVGAMGSRRTHERRMRALAQSVPPELLERLHSPIGLDLGASTPQETAVAILAEVIGARHGASGGPLRAATGPIHRPTLSHASRGI